MLRLQDAYERRDYDEFASLFPTPADSAPYLHMLPESLPPRDLTDELRIHHRLFHCEENPIPGEPPGPDSLCLEAISMSLARQSPWEERPDVYRSPANPGGIDAARWKAVGAEWHAEILFETQGSTDYSVDRRSYFTVIEDRTKTAGTDRKFLIYRWEDLSTGNPKPALPKG